MTCHNLHAQRLHSCKKKELDATARVDLPDRRASARLEAIETMWPSSCRAAVPRTTAKPAASNEYRRRAQVIVEGREEQSDGGEKNKDNQNTPKPNKPQPASLHHHVVFPLSWVKQVKQKLMTSNGPEFTNEKLVGAGLCSSKVSKKGFKWTLLHDC